MSTTCGGPRGLLTCKLSHVNLSQKRKSMTITTQQDIWWAVARSEEVTDKKPLGINIGDQRSEEHTSELQSLMRISYAVFCLKKINTGRILTIWFVVAC